MSGFFDEVKRRKVYRVAVAYVVVAVGAIQLASAVFPAWELPSWALRLVIVLLLLGFPIALIFAWAYDVTPQGIRATPPAALASPRRHGRRNLLILLGSGLLISIAAGLFILPRAAARKIEKSIAVLPFENFSDDKENTYFADGIQDDILTNLAKIGDLKVISRTSVMSFRGQNRSVRDIAKALGVGAVLEGSVRRSGNRVRVNVQLINAENDKHIWAEEYDRDLTDIFAIQTDLARKIAAELRAKLSPSEKAQLSRKPTENGEAYLAFVQAHNLHLALEDDAKLKQAEQLYARAVQLDPNFALAWARYSQLESWRYHSGDPTPQLRDAALRMAEQALQLQPSLPEAHLARGFVYYYGDQNFDAALREFIVAQQGLPNDAEVYLAQGAIQRRKGQWAESTANIEKAAALDPKSVWPLQNLFFNYEMTRDYAAANKTLDRGLALEPNSFTLWGLKAKLAVEEKGDLSVAEKKVAEFAKMPLEKKNLTELHEVRIKLLVVQRKFAEALQAIESIKDEEISNLPGALLGKYLEIGWLKTELNDEEGARAALRKGKQLAEERVAANPQKPEYRCHLAYALARLDEKAAAAEQVRRAMELLPESKDAFTGPQITQQAAEVYAIIGDNNRAFELLDGLLTRPTGFTVQLLKLDPIWDSLRDDPRFDQLLTKYGAKA
jgi:TolB-like protein/Flp pilus assembly protein TadD